MRLRNSVQTEAAAEQIEKEVRQLTNEYEKVQALIRSQSPRYASLMQPRPPSLEEIQAELRGDDTILLEYAMGEEKSYLWAVTSDFFSGYELPARAQIEELTREVHSLLTTRPGDDIATPEARAERHEQQSAKSRGAESNSVRSRGPTDR